MEKPTNRLNPEIQIELRTAEFPDDASMRVSHETIYRSLSIQARGVLKKELIDHLRSKRRMRRSRHATVSGQSRGQIVDAISISDTLRALGGE